MWRRRGMVIASRFRKERTQMAARHFTRVFAVKMMVPVPGILGALLLFPAAAGYAQVAITSLPDAPLPNMITTSGSGNSRSVDQQGQPESQSAPKDQGKKKGKYSPSATTGSPGHIFWVIPAFKVTYQNEFKPLTPKEKFQEWAQSEYDPLGLGAGAVEAGTLEYSSTDGFCGYGGGWAGYGKCFGSLELDAADSSFIGDYALTVLLHQDPRYFRLGKGSFGKRVLYTVSRVFITFNDSGHNTFYTSALTGTVAAAAISNLYYPQQDRGAGLTMSRIAIDLGNTALYNAAAEFWPDIHRRLHQAF